MLLSLLLGNVYDDDDDTDDEFPMPEGSDPLSLDRPKRPDGLISPFSCEFGAISYNGTDFISHPPQHR